MTTTTLPGLSDDQLLRVLAACTALDPHERELFMQRFDYHLRTASPEKLTEQVVDAAIDKSLERLARASEGGCCGA
jgi:hypothetical protein